MTSPNVLLTEIALDLLGNKFYDIYGKCVSDLDALFNVRCDAPAKPNEKDLLSILQISEVSFRAADNTKDEIINLEDDDANISSTHALIEENALISNVLPTNKHESYTHNVSLAESNFLSLTPANPIVEILSDLEDEESDPTSSLFNSQDQSERLNYILSTANKEYENMKQRSTEEFFAYLGENANKFKSEENCVQSYTEDESLNLIKLSSACMQSIKHLKHDENNARNVLIRVAEDILKAKHML